MSLPDDLEAEQSAAIQKSEVFSFDLKKFESDLPETGGDLMTLIIRSQLYLEHVILQTLRDAFSVPNAIDLRRLNFPSKLNLCIALGLYPADWRESVNRINEMRNRIAHNLDAEFSDTDRDSFWASLPAFLRGLILEHVKSKNPNADTAEFPTMVKTLILWLDIARQQAQAQRVRHQIGEKWLRRTLDHVRARHPEC